MHDLDSTDRQILRILQADSRMPVAKIAEQVSLSTSSYWRRINALEKSGVIQNFSVRLDPDAVGLGFQAIVHVHLTRHDRDQIRAFFAAIDGKPEVRECYATTGQADYHMFVQCRNVAAYNQFLGRLSVHNASRGQRTNEHGAKDDQAGCGWALDQRLTARRLLRFRLRLRLRPRQLRQPLSSPENGAP